MQQDGTKVRCATLRPDGMMTQFNDASLYSRHEDTVCKTLQQDARAVLAAACLFVTGPEWVWE